MAKLNLLRWNLDYLKAGVKVDTWASFRKIPLHFHALLLNYVLLKAEDKIKYQTMRLCVVSPSWYQVPGALEVATSKTRPLNQQNNRPGGYLALVVTHIEARGSSSGCHASQGKITISVTITV